MAAQDNFINAKNSVEQLNEVFERHKKAVSGAVDEMSKLVGEYEKLPSSFKKLIEQAEKNNININNTKNALSEQEKLMRQVAAERERLALATSKENQELQKLRAEKAKINAEYRKESKAQQEQNTLSQQAGNYYEQLRIRIARLTQEYQNLAAKKAITGSLTEKEEKRMANLSARLDNYGKTVQKINGATGKAASGFDGLRWQTQQLVRELPAAAYGINVFFGAISNNLPMFIDEVKKARLENEALMKSGKEAPSVMKRVAGAFFNWQTAIVLVITALTLYSKEIIKAIKGANSFESAIDRSDRANRQFAEGLAQTQAQHQAEIVILNTLVKIIQDETQGREKRSQAVQVLQDKYPDYLKNLNEENITSKEISASIDQISDSLFRKAQVQAASDLVTEKYREYLEKYVKAQIDAEKKAKTMFRAEQDRYSVRMDMLRREEQQWKLLASSQDASDYVKETSERLTNELLKMQQMTQEQALEYMKQGFIAEFARSESEDALQIYNDFNRILEDILKDAPNLFDIFGYPKGGGKGKAAAEKQVKDITSLYDLIHFRISARIEDEKKLAETEGKTYQSRLDHLRAWVNHSMVLLQIETDEKRKLAEKAIKDGTADENALTLVTEEALRKRLLLQQDYANRISEIQQSEWDEQFKKIGLFTREQELNLQEWENAFIESNLNMGKSYKEVQEDLTKEKRKQLEQQIKDLLAALETEIEMVAVTCEQELQMREAVAKKVAKLNQIYLEYSKEQADAVSDVVSVFRELGNQIGINGTTWGNFFRGVFDGFEDSADAAKSFGQLMIEISETIVRHQNMQIENQIRNLERQKDVQLQFAGESEAARTQIEERFDKKKTELMNQQARKEKALAIMQALISTAAAVTKALPNVALAISVGSVGAAQAAIIAATPIPQFEHGVRDFEGGNAIINEKRDEVVTTPDGQVFKPKGRNLFVDLPKGASVYSSEREFYREMNGILGHNNIMPVIQDVSNYGITKEQMEGIMAKTLAKQNVQNINLDKNGFVSYIIGRHSKTNILNNRVTFKGKNV